jgi:hypothetical protein
MENISDNQEATFSLVAVLFIMKSVHGQRDDDVCSALLLRHSED